MKISIAERYHPFSHEPGIRCILPGSNKILQVFPALIRIGLFEQSIEIPIDLHGPVREFSVQQDLEKGCVWIWGIAIEGRFRLKLQATVEGFDLDVIKAPKGLFSDTHFSRKMAGPYHEAKNFERLSLGVHRSQEWPIVWRRLDVEEILPILYHLGQWVPESKIPSHPMVELLHQGWEPFLRAAFSSLLTPGWVDDQYQGIIECKSVGADPCALLIAAKDKIRSLLIDQNEQAVSLFAPPFNAGRFTNVQLKDCGSIDWEWRGKMIRRAVIHAAEDTRLILHFPSSIRSMRLRTAPHEKGIRVAAGEPLALQASGKYLLDRFQK